jgi:hypothetical protein
VFALESETDPTHAQALVWPARAAPQRHHHGFSRRWPAAGENGRRKPALADRLGQQRIHKECAATRLRRYNFGHHTITVRDDYCFAASSQAVLRTLRPTERIRSWQLPEATSSILSQSARIVSARTILSQSARIVSARNSRPANVPQCGTLVDTADRNALYQAMAGAGARS